MEDLDQSFAAVFWVLYPVSGAPELFVLLDKFSFFFFFWIPLLLDSDSSEPGGRSWFGIRQ